MDRRYLGVPAIILLVVILTSAACDRVPLFAPSQSTITLSAPTRVLPLGGSTEISATVLEQGGTPVQNGTTVIFTTTLGHVSQAEVQTRNGIATTTFLAGETSGVAEIRASSGAAGGTTTSGTGSTTTTTTNVIQITIGAAATDSLVLRANPSSVGPGGGTVELVATVLGQSGRVLSGIPVTFTANNGSLSSTSATTDDNGEARVRLTTSVQTTVRARAAGKESNEITIGVRTTPSVTLTCQGSGTSASSSCSQVVEQPVTFTAARAATTSALTSARLDFGDGTSTNLGTLSSSATVTHTYTSVRTFTATLTATDVNGETTSASVAVNVIARPPTLPLGVNITATAGTKTATSQQWSFDADATEGTTAATNIESYTWDFGDGTGATTSGDKTSHVYTSLGQKTVTVTVRTTDNRSATGRTEIIVQFP